MSYKFKDLVILIPSFNEEESLKTLTKKLCRNFKNIVAVNDYSADNSLKILKKYPVKVFNNNKKLGYWIQDLYRRLNLNIHKEL